MKQRLQNDSLARLLHEQLYKRMLAFCEEYTPEIPAEVIVRSWLQRLYNSDLNLHILVVLNDNYLITGHAVIDVQEAFGCKVVYCYQAHADKGYSSTLTDGIEYVDTLAKSINAHCSVFSVTKHLKGLEKKYGYNISRTTMIKSHSEVSVLDEGE